MNKPIGILFMAYGGPETLDDIPGYLADIRAGRVTPQRVLDEITNNYRLIGGKSPLPEFTRAQVSATMEQLAKTGGDYRAYIGMRHWSPWIEDAVRDMLIDLGAERFQVHLEQRPEQHRHRDDVEEQARRGRQVLRREGRQLAELVGLR